MTMGYLCTVVPSSKKQFDRLVQWGGVELEGLYELCKPNILAYK